MKKVSPKSKLKKLNKVSLKATASKDDRIEYRVDKSGRLKSVVFRKPTKSREITKYIGRRNKKEFPFYEKSFEREQRRNKK